MTERTTDAAARRPRRASWRLRLLLVVMGVVLATAAGEIAARVFAWTQERNALAAWQQLATPRQKPSVDREAALNEVVRLARNPRIVYELFPNLDFQLIARPCRTNEHGFRGPPLARQKPPNGYRVVVLGDSVAFGWGVQESECFPRVLERLLQDALPGRTVQVVNTSVPGYNTAMEVETLVDKGLVFAPDLVVLSVVGNDLDLPNLIWTPQDFFAPGRSFLWEQIAKAWRTRDPWSDRPWSLTPVADDGRYLYREGAVAPQYRDMVGIEMFQRELRRLRDLGQQHGFRVLVAGNMNAAGFVGETCAATGLRYFRANDAIEPYMKEHGIANYYKSELTVSAKDPHPGPIAHRLVAEGILAMLRAEAMLPE
jgi:hypothetical protein